MAKPGSNSGARSSTSIFGGWKERREAKKQEVLERAAKKITNETAKNENTIVDTLAEIDFLHSGLPKDILNYKSNENQPYGDLQLSAKMLSKLLFERPQTIKMDIREIDKRLLALAMMFKEAVEQGDVKAAYAAKAGLARGINDIRNRIPQNQPELARPFVEQNAAYLDGWLVLVGSAKMIDMERRNIEVLRTHNKELAERLREEEEAFKNDIQEGTARGEAMAQIIDHDSVEERKNWTPIQREVHRAMVEHSLDKNVYQLSDYTLNQKEIELITNEKNVEVLQQTVNTVPIVVDPNLMNKQKEQIQRMMHSLAETDARIDETLKFFDELEGMIDQFEHAPGNENAKQRAREDAAAMFKQLQDEQENRIKPRNGSLAAIRGKYHIMDEAEVAAIEAENIAIAEAEKAERAEAQAEMQYAQEQNVENEEVEDNYAYVEE